MPASGFEAFRAQAQANDSKQTVWEPSHQYMYRDQPIRLNLQVGQRAPKVHWSAPVAGFGPHGPKFDPNICIECVYADWGHTSAARGPGRRGVGGRKPPPNKCFETPWVGGFWSPVGSPLVPFWHPLAAFWLPLAPFWLPLAPFWLTLAPFWLTFGALWLTFAHPGSQFSHFCCILASFWVFFHIFLENIMQNHIFKQFSPKITFAINQIVFSRRVPNAPQQKVHLLL